MVVVGQPVWCMLCLAQGISLIPDLQLRNNPSAVEGKCGCIVYNATTTPLLNQSSVVVSKHRTAPGYLTIYTIEINKRL